MTPTLTQIVKNNRCYFSYLRQNQVFYTVDYCFDEEPNEYSISYTFGFYIPLEDVGGATLNREEKAISLMRWIRRAMDNNEFVLVNCTSKK